MIAKFKIKKKARKNVHIKTVFLINVNVTRNLTDNVYQDHDHIHDPSVSIIDLVSNTTYIVCLNFIHK